MLDRITKQSELGKGRGSYAVILLVLPLGSLKIAKFNVVSVHCFVVALFSALYVLSVYYCTWTIYINITILWTETATHAQAVGTTDWATWHHGAFFYIAVP